MRKIIITAAVVGSNPTKTTNPAVPYTPAEIAQAAIDSYHAGAAIAHIHVRDPETGAPSSKLELFREVLERIRAETDMLVNLTTSGLNITGEEDNVIVKRLEPVTLRPDLASLDIGSLNFGARVFQNSPKFGETAAKMMREYRVKPEVEVFDVGHIDQANDMVARGLLDAPPWYQLCMGIRWGIPATLENLIFMLRKLPANAEWSVLGVGRHQLPMITAAILLGGHIRVGFEDNVYLRKGVLAESNAQMVAHAATLIRHLHYEVANPQDARNILGIV